MLKIVKTPVPPKPRKGPPVKYPLAIMRVGESFFVPSNTVVYRNFVSHVCKRAVTLRRKFQLVPLKDTTIQVTRTK
jgi:hypothetical protein